jgi:hypothetical protein
VGPVFVTVRVHTYRKEKYPYRMSQGGAGICHRACTYVPYRKMSIPYGYRVGLDMGLDGLPILFFFLKQGCSGVFLSLLQVGVPKQASYLISRHLLLEY